MVLETDKLSYRAVQQLAVSLAGRILGYIRGSLGNSCIIILIIITTIITITVIIIISGIILRGVSPPSPDVSCTCKLLLEFHRWPRVKDKPEGQGRNTQSAETCAKPHEPLKL